MKFLGRRSRTVRACLSDTMPPRNPIEKACCSFLLLFLPSHTQWTAAELLLLRLRLVAYMALKKRLLPFEPAHCAAYCYLGGRTCPSRTLMTSLHLTWFFIRAESLSLHIQRLDCASHLSLSLYTQTTSITPIAEQLLKILLFGEHHVIVAVQLTSVASLYFLPSHRFLPSIFTRKIRFTCSVFLLKK